MPQVKWMACLILQRVFPNKDGYVGVGAVVGVGIGVGVGYMYLCAYWLVGFDVSLLVCCLFVLIG